jgi:serine/threonine protein kinase
MLDVATARKIFYQMVLGVLYLHEVCGKAHLDLKPENFVIGKDKKVKLIDTAFSVNVDETCYVS